MLFTLFYLLMEMKIKRSYVGAAMQIVAYLMCFCDANNPNKIIGVDADIIQALAEHLGMKAEFVQNQWDGLIPGLIAGNYDVVIDGL